nr:putative ribonuclease H-like domain-containing protein [Tanacetum cinerariifolium]
PHKVYKVEKALYGLHQALGAWYETLSTFLLENGFRKGTIDKALFIKKIKNDILLVQVYVDDIIFGSTKRSLSTEFEQLMHKRFQMSSMGEITFFLGLQVKQQKDSTFLSQEKYVCHLIEVWFFYCKVSKYSYGDTQTFIKGYKWHRCHRQEEGIDYDEVFAHVARIEAIGLFLDYALFMDFTVYQMDVKSAFLYGTIKEKVYVSQPSGFMDPEFPHKVYKVEKALYGLHQALGAWLSSEKIAPFSVKTNMFVIL